MVTGISKEFDDYIIASKTDLTGKIIYVSEAFCKISGYTKEELIGKPHSIVRHPDMPELIYADLWDTISQGNTWTGEIKNLRKDGNFYWVDVVIAPDYDQNGEKIGYTAIRTDITAKKEVELLKYNLEDVVASRTKDLEKTKQEAEQILSSILLPVLITDKETRQIVYANKFAETQYDTKLEDMIGSQIQDLYITEGQSEELVRQMQTEGRITNLEQDFQTHIGKKFTALLSVIPIIYKGNESYIGMVTDITKQKEIQKTIKNLLDNAGQGFLYFNKDMIIGAEYSKKAYTIFGKDIAGEDITKLLHEDEGDRLFYQSTLQSILTEDDMRQEVLISLLPHEFKINNRFIEVEYKVLSEESFMMILTDVTVKKRLDQKVKDEQQTLKMVIEIVTTKEQFLEVKSDYEHFVENLDELKTLETLADLRREVHTYKGLFAQKEMLHVVKKLHDFESLIDDSLKHDKMNEEIENTTKEDMLDWLGLDLSIIENILGDDYFAKAKYMEVSRYRLEQLDNKVKQFIETQDEHILKEISNETRNLKYNNIKIFFRPYEKLVEQLAHDLDKYINPLQTDIQNIYIDDKFIPFINSLVHIFRNSVDHGIETLDERLESGKEEFGTISCMIHETEHKILMLIADDGKGIDVQKIKELAVKKGVYTQEEVDKLTDDEVVLIIFKDAFTTSDHVTKISGRGVGLASLLNELEKLNGTMKVINKFGEGITFKFSIPKGEE